MRGTVAGFALSILALWHGESIFAQENTMRNGKKPNQLSSLLTYGDVRSVSPALEHYTKGPLLMSGSVRVYRHATGAW
jgi:hypothetical protein